LPRVAPCSASGVGRSVCLDHVRLKRQDFREIGEYTAGAMKEVWKPTLTNRSQKPYSGYGDNIMPENVDGQQPQKPPEENISPERIENARKDWTTYRGPLEKLTHDERQAIEEAVKIGRGPLSQEEIKEINDKFGGAEADMWGHGFDEELRKSTMEDIINSRSTRKTSEETPKIEASGAGGPPKEPLAGHEAPPAVEEDGDNNEGRQEGVKITDQRLIEVVNRVNQTIKTAGGARTVNPEFINSQINEIRDLLGRHPIDASQSQAVKDMLYRMLAEQGRGYDSYREKMREILDLPEGEARKKEVIELLSQMSPYANSLDPEFVREVAKDRVALDYLVNRIIAQPLDAEQEEYRLSFYGGINLDQIKDVLKTRAGGSGEQAQEAENSYKKVLYVSGAAQLFHTMNLQIITGNLEQFVNGARAISPEQLQIMQNIPGVAQIMRIFDEEIFRVLNKNKMIDNKSYDKLMGLIRNSETGEIMGWEKEGGTVEKRFRELVKTREIEGISNLEDWQVKWAFHVGKIMGNLSLRTAEQISLSKVPGGDRQYASIPQESAARLMNWIGWTGMRFNMAEARGGIFLAKMTSKFFQRDREEQGYGKSKIQELGWQKLEDFELSGIFGVTGIWSSWRQNLIILGHAPSGDRITPKGENERIKSIGEFLSEAGKFKLRSSQDPDKLLEKSEFVQVLGLKGKRLKEALDMESAERLKEVFLMENGDLNSQRFNNALGLILKHGSINPSEKDLPIFRKAKEDVRAAIWRSIAVDNPLAIIPYLQNTVIETGRVVDGKKEGTTIALTGFDTDEWDTFTNHMSTLNEIRMQKIRKGEFITLRQVVESENSRDGGIKLTKYENDLLDEIKLKGDSLSFDLANVRFPNNPFMNDVLFERANYSEAGAEFYRRRAGGDLSSFHKAGEEFSKLMMNPGGTPPEDAFKAILGGIEAIGSPLGTDAGQDRMRQFLEAYLTFISKGDYLGVDVEGGIAKGPLWEVVRWLNKDNAFSGIQSRLRKPTSIAQVISGVDAPSIDEFGMRSILDKLLHDGLTRRASLDEYGMVKYIDVDEKFRKKLKAGLLGILLAFIRDVPKIVLAGAVSELGQKISKTK